MIYCTKKHCCLSTIIITHTHTESSKAVHTRPTAMVKFTSTFPRSSPLLVTIYPPSCPCRLFAALLFSNQHFLEAVFFPWETGSTLLSNVLAVNEETACFFGFLNEPSSWLGTGNPETGQANSYSVWKICFG